MGEAEKHANAVLDRRLYKLDVWDAAILLACWGVSRFAAAALALSFYEGMFAATWLAFLVMQARRRLSPRRNELLYTEAPRADAKRIVPIVLATLAAVAIPLGALLVVLAVDMGRDEWRLYPVALGCEAVAVTLLVVRARYLRAMRRPA